MRKSLALATTAAVMFGLAITAVPASAADTTVTFTLTGGGLTIAAPDAPAALTGGGIADIAGATVAGPLGDTVVSDQRGGVLGWTTTIAGTAFSNGTGEGTTTIPVGNVKAFVPGVIVPSGVVTATTTYLTAANGLALTTTGQNFVAGTVAVGVNGATFNPSVSVAIPANATVGNYSGKITQTVS